MPKPTVQQLLQAYDEYDKNEDGKLQAEELFHLMKQFGDDEITEQDVKDFLDENDINHDGVISREEYVKFVNRVLGDEDEDD